MLCAGDERGKTQLGNNNAYCQDTNLSWLNWDLFPFQQDLEETTAFLIKLRQENPVLRPKHFANYESANEVSDRMRWFNKSGELMSEQDWANSQCRTLMRLTDHQSEPGKIESMLLVVHGSEADDELVLPKLEGQVGYELLWDSNWERPEPSQKLAPGAKLGLGGLSMMLLRVL